MDTEDKSKEAEEDVESDAAEGDDDERGPTESSTSYVPLCVDGCAAC
jgi:hypothetical protein